jgi:uncharacterized repeat protein (TIGR01451 family)
MPPIISKQIAKVLSKPFLPIVSAQKRSWLSGGMFLLIATGSSHVAAQTLLVEEEFKDPTSFGWSVGAVNNAAIACLTAGNATTPPSSIPACPTTLNQPGSGALRITTAEKNQAAFAFYDFPIPARAGLEINFDYFSYGGTPIETGGSEADGITFFLFDGSTNAPVPGGFGGSLGYAQLIPLRDAPLPGGLPIPPTLPGLTNAFVGVGFDEFGNFARDMEERVSRGEGCTNSSPNADRVLDSVTVRGSGSGLTGYCYLANSGNLPEGIDVPNAPNREIARRRVRIVLTQNFDLSVEIAFGDGQFQTVIPGISLLSFPDQENPPSDFKFGFASSTGGATNIHEVRNLRIQTITTTPQPDLEITKSHAGNFIAGGKGEYTLTATNIGNGPTFGPLIISDTLPPGFSLSSFRGTGWDCSENPPGTVTCVYEGDPRSADPATDPPLSPGESQSVVIEVNVTDIPGTYTNLGEITNPADLNPENNKATDETIVVADAEALRLVKRITAATRAGVPLSGIGFDRFVDNPNDPNDNAPGFSQLLPVGVTQIDPAIELQSQDEVEYTIYYLADGGEPLQAVNVCDLVPTGTTFVNNSFGSEQGILLNRAGLVSPQTNALDTDAGSFFSPLTPLPNRNGCQDASNPNGAVLMNLGEVSNELGSNFGFMRFRVLID